MELGLKEIQTMNSDQIYDAIKDVRESLFFMYEFAFISDNPDTDVHFFEKIVAEEIKVSKTKYDGSKPYKVYIKNQIARRLSSYVKSLINNPEVSFTIIKSMIQWVTRRPRTGNFTINIAINKLRLLSNLFATINYELDKQLLREFLNSRTLITKNNKTYSCQCESYINCILIMLRNSIDLKSLLISLPLLKVSLELLLQGEYEYNVLLLLANNILSSPNKDKLNIEEICTKLQDLNDLLLDLEYKYNDAAISFLFRTSPKFKSYILKIKRESNNPEQSCPLVEKGLKAAELYPVYTPEFNNYFDGTSCYQEKSNADIFKPPIDLHTAMYIFYINIKLAYNVLNSFYRKRNKEDLRQEALLALYQAIYSFKPEENVQFSTYACSCIRYHLIRRCLKDSIIGKSYNAAEKFSKYKKAYLNFWNEHQREPTIEELSSITGFSSDIINSFQRSENVISFDVFKNDPLSITIPSGEITENYDELLYKSCLLNLLIECGLNYSEIRVISLVLSYDSEDIAKTHSDIAEIINVTRQRVSFLYNRAIKKIKARYTSYDDAMLKIEPIDIPINPRLNYFFKGYSDDVILEIIIQLDNNYISTLKLLFGEAFNGNMCWEDLANVFLFYRKIKPEIERLIGEYQTKSESIAKTGDEQRKTFYIQKVS